MRSLPLSLLLFAAGLCLALPAACVASDSTPHVVMAGGAQDTLSYDWQQVFPVAIAELEKDHWIIQRADTTSPTRRLVTRWKPLKHPLARLFLGGVMARCVVDLEPLADGRTVVRMQGGLASAQDIEGNPGYPAAQSTYRRAAEKWLADVRQALAAPPG